MKVITLNRLKKQARFGDILKVNADHCQYALCTWSVKKADPNFIRGILLTEKAIVEHYLPIAGRYLEIEIKGRLYIAFTWLDAPIILNKKIGNVCGQISYKMANNLFEACKWDAGDGNPEHWFSDLILQWRDKQTMSDMFDWLDGKYKGGKK